MEYFKRKLNRFYKKTKFSYIILNSSYEMEGWEDGIVKLNL